MKGHRKLVFGLLGLSLLVLGLGLCLAFPEPGKILFTGYATAVVGIVVAVVGGNVGEHLAKREGP